MKVLLDTCISSLAADIVRQAGHDVVWSGDWSSDPGDGQSSSERPTNHASLVTIDKDLVN